MIAALYAHVPVVRCVGSPGGAQEEVAGPGGASTGPGRQGCTGIPAAVTAAAGREGWLLWQPWADR